MTKALTIYEETVYDIKHTWDLTNNEMRLYLKGGIFTDWIEITSTKKLNHE